MIRPSQNAETKLEIPNAAISSRNLMEQALFGDLCTKMSPMDHRRAGWPVASLVDFATDAEGTPIFSLSPMAGAYTRPLFSSTRALCMG